MTLNHSYSLTQRDLGQPSTKFVCTKRTSKNPPPPPATCRKCYYFQTLLFVFFSSPSKLTLSQTNKVPGIAVRGAEILAEGEGDDCVTNTYQLIGKFLALRGPDKDDHEVWRAAIIVGSSTGLSVAGEGRNVSACSMCVLCILARRFLSFSLRPATA